MASVPWNLRKVWNSVAPNTACPDGSAGNGGVKLGPNRLLAGAPRRDIEALDRELQAKRQTLQTALRQGPAALMRLNQEIIAARPRLMPLLEKAWDNLKVADAQRKAL